ncbi:MAG: DNA mismatch repair protein MutS, partial [Flavobacteriaceae bacterium]|nr:DNA mismatch repair protein MutS [Flavobacteriaceae bacterium]
MAKKSKKVTPLMQQYNAIKAKYPDALLLFRVGDFYETFGKDAVKASKILDIILTKRGSGSESETELAGFPHHSLNTYLPKLVKAGQRVAICDQLEDPKLTKTIVKRGVTELVTPGVAINDDILTAKSNNFLAAVHFGKNILGVSFLDISTGEFVVSQGSDDYIDKLLRNFNPSEILVSKPHKKEFAETFGSEFHTFYMEDWVFKDDFANESLLKHFETKNLKGFGIDDLYEGIVAAGAVLHYLSETQHHRLQHISSIQRLNRKEHVWMDKFTIQNLELYSSHNRNAVTLIDIIDKTQSSMGGRLLKRWLAFPLVDIDKIKSRHSSVEYFVKNPDLLSKIQSQLKEICDIERLISKVATGKINPRETVLLKNALEAIIPIKENLRSCDNEPLRTLGKKLNECDDLREQISKCLNEDAPVNILKGGTIRSNFSAELQELRSLHFSSKDYLDNMLKRESEKTGITSLKIASNNVFGYYIEVRNTHKDKVPESWIRKQTLVSAERYITEELKEYEAKILGAEERILAIEQQLFSELIGWISKFIKEVQINASLIAEIDCLCGFATLAKECNYTKPVINDSQKLDITGGRHPVIERQLPHSEPFIANDLSLDRDSQQIIMITGPNMSGKSAILRQTALIVLLAQMGSFVPADRAEIGIVDKIFTRVGASDNISLGESTFMVEMNETASILNNISERSLVLLDEIGRGTSTYDGISIAWAISEYLHEHPARPKTLFATHYHELNEMSETFSRIKNYNVAVKELKDRVLFLRKLVEGGSEHSFGIHVAKMAGMPQQVIHRANKILKQLEKSHSSDELTNKVRNLNNEMQLSFFNLDDPLLERIKEEIVNIDIDTLT